MSIIISLTCGKIKIVNDYFYKQCFTDIGINGECINGFNNIEYKEEL